MEATSENSILTLLLYTDDKRYNLQDVTKQDMKTAKKEALASMVKDETVVKVEIVRVTADGDNFLQPIPWTTIDGRKTIIWYLNRIHAEPWIVEYQEQLKEEKTSRRFSDSKKALKWYYELQLQGYMTWTNVPGARV